MNHGTSRAYNSGCRCQECRTTKARSLKHHRHITHRGRARIVHLIIDATEVREHLRELKASGWSGAMISEESGVSTAAISELRTGRNPRTRASIAAALLAVQPLTPVGVDEVAVLRFIADDIDWRALTVAERIEAGIRMDHMGISRKEILARTHVNTQLMQAAFNAERVAS